jgi:hypothetical protein
VLAPQKLILGKVKKMAKNIEKLAEVGELALKEKIEHNLRRISDILRDLELFNKDRGGNECRLKQNVIDYNENINLSVNECGLGFPVLQEAYSKMLPEIKKYIEVKE